MRKSIHTDEYVALRARLSAIRAAAGLSQRGLAERLHVPHSWVAKVESGERRIDVVEFGWFCVSCGASPAVEATRLWSAGGLTRRPSQPTRGGGHQ